MHNKVDEENDYVKENDNIEVKILFSEELSNVRNEYVIQVDGKVITSIGANAFSSSSVKVVTLPSTVTTIGKNAFANCTALTDFKAPQNISVAVKFSECTNLTHDSLMSIINNLATVSSKKTLTLDSTLKAKLTSEEIAIATAKNWTVS